MTEQEKQKHFCHSHPNLFAQSRCNNCFKGMCHTCIHNNPTLCTACLKSSFLTGDQYKNQKELIYILSIGLGVGLLYHIYQFTTIKHLYNNFNFVNDLLYVTIGTLTVISAYYMYSETTIISDIRKIPFIGGKLALLLIIFSLVIGIPLFYLLYKISLFIWQKITNQKHQV
ncbi:hypothetical protein [Aquimarina sp. Aq107]|uniref:hypothetical protein n=1 Tax=Aquimarina sp. Aq107 TaxID=1191912 RepID=UPI000D54FB12|nr:hypothetical protein [Aquimarina sp. Aq107]